MYKINDNIYYLNDTNEIIQTSISAISDNTLYFLDGTKTEDKIFVSKDKYFLEKIKKLKEKYSIEKLEKAKDEFDKKISKSIFKVGDIIEASYTYEFKEKGFFKDIFKLEKEHFEFFVDGIGYDPLKDTIIYFIKDTENDLIIYENKLYYTYRHYSYFNYHY